MLSTVKIFAIGHTGQETLDLFAGAESVSFENVGGDFFAGETQELEFTTTQQLTAADIEIQFNNDLYDPANGIDRNLTIERIEIDGVAYETESDNVYSEGNFFTGEGASGFGLPNTLYGNGKFIYGQDFSQSSEVVVYASGATGDERMSVLVGDRVVGSFSVSNNPFGYRMRVNQRLTGEEVRVRFDNDLYLPDEGIDRNLFVDRIAIDGREMQTESPRVVSTGTWRPGVGIQTGNFETETLHADGEFIYFDSTIDGISFAGRVWSTNDSAVVNRESGNNISVATNGSGDGVISTQVDITQGQRFKLFANIVRRPSEGAQNVGNAYLGIDYLDADGTEIGEQFFEVNSGFPFIDQFIDAPTGTASGIVSMVVKDEGPDSAVVRFDEFRLTQVNDADTSPPEVELLNDGEVFTEPTSQLNFTARYTDDTELTFGTGIISVRPANTQQSARGTNIRFQNSTSVTEKIAEISYSAPGALFTRFSPADNGEYELVLRGDTLRDASGNFAPEQILGTFTIQIPETADTTAPNVVTTQTSAALPQSGIPAFSVEITDDQSGVNIDEIGEYSEAIGLPFISVFSDAGEQFFLRQFGGLQLGNGYLFSFGFENAPTEPGTYFITDEVGISDNAGNVISQITIGSLSY